VRQLLASSRQVAFQDLPHVFRANPLSLHPLVQLRYGFG
jgi:hypothetical protein